MRDVLCPNCQKDEYRIIRINGVKVKQCRICGAYYQLAEEEVNAIDYLPDSKDAEGNFVKCPVCGCENIKKFSQLSGEEFTWTELLFSRRVGRILNASHWPDSDHYYICLNRKCGFIWEKKLVW